MVPRPSPLRPESVRKIWPILNHDLSPDGRTLAYSVNRGANYTIRLLDTKTGRDRPLVQGVESASRPAWSPDGTRLAFQSDSQGDENHDVYVAPAKGGEAKNITNHPADDAEAQWSPDGSLIAFISNRDREVENLFIVASEGGKPLQLTTSESPVAEFTWRPDGQGLAYVTGVGNNTKLHHVDLRGHSRVLLASPRAEFYLSRDGAAIPRPWSPDSTALAFVSNEHDHDDIGILHLGRDKVQWFAADETEKDAPQWSPDGQGILYRELWEANIRLVYRGVGSASRRPISPERGVARGAAWHPTAAGVVYLHSDATHPEDMFWVGAAGRPRRRLTRSLRTALPPSLVTPRHIHYPSFDDRQIPALLYVPRRRNGAAVVVPHGGPEWLRLNDFAEVNQLFASRGYVVMAPNYRGSTGYGRAYRKLSDHDLGGGDLQDVVHSAKYLVDQGLAAEDRIGMWGHSYGGFMALHALTQAPDVWRVGVSAMGFFDWKTAIAAERETLRIYDREKMGDPDSDPEFFRSRSPFFHVDKLRAPLLMFAGTQDPRCPVTEARQVEQKLRSMGVPVEYIEYGDEGHWPHNMDNVVDLLKRSVEFIVRHMPPGA